MTIPQGFWPQWPQLFQVIDFFFSNMTSAAPPRPDLTAKKSPRRQPGWLSKKNFLGIFDVADCQHTLKLRNKWNASDQFTIEIGADCTTSTCTPWAGVKLLLDKDEPDGWAMEVNTDWALLQSPAVDLCPFTDSFSLPVNARIGTNFYDDNSPHIEIGIKNKAVIITMLVCSLILQKPAALHVKRKEIGGFDFSVPVSKMMASSVEVDASVRRKGWRLLVSFSNMSPVLRLH